MRAAATSRQGRHEQDGFVAGLEALAFGVLVFVVGTLVVLNAWTVVDAKFAVEGAAREAARSVVETAATVGGAGAPTDAHRAVARAAADEVLAGLRGPGSRVDEDVQVLGSIQRGACIEVRVSMQVPVVRLPLLGSPGGTRPVIGTHRERVDPFRSGLAVRDGEALLQPCEV